MTREELNYIKDSFSQILDDIGGNPDWYDAAKAVASDLGTMEKQLEERVTKLPSNLDEAANDGWAVYEYRESPRGLYSTCYVDGFKAGAEWMAEQFQKIEGDLVDWYSTSDGKDYCCGVKTQDAFEVPEGFYIKKK